MREQRLYDLVAQGHGELLGYSASAASAASAAARAGHASGGAGARGHGQNEQGMAIYGAPPGQMAGYASINKAYNKPLERAMHAGYG